jgi:hypothetical protein
VGLDPLLHESIHRLAQTFFVHTVQHDGGPGSSQSLGEGQAKPRLEPVTRAIFSLRSNSSKPMGQSSNRNMIGHKPASWLHTR